MLNTPSADNVASYSLRIDIQKKMSKFFFLHTSFLSRSLFFSIVLINANITQSLLFHFDFDQFLPILLESKL